MNILSQNSRIMQDISSSFFGLVGLEICIIISSLRYAFQSQTKLYLVMDFFNGGELYHYLSMGRFSEVGLRVSVNRRNVLYFMPQRYL